ADFLVGALGLNVESVSIEQLGFARKITITNKKNTIIADTATKDEIHARIAQIKSELAKIDSSYDKEKLSERITKLSGGATEAELEDRKLKIEDAKSATFAAIEEGIVLGGGAAYVHLSSYVPAIKESIDNPEERLGADILQKVLLAPAKLIANNAGIEGAIVLEKILSSTWEMGYNAMTDTHENLLNTGVMDAAKVARCALQNAASVAGTVLTTKSECQNPKSPMFLGSQAYFRKGMTICKHKDHHYEFSFIIIYVPDKSLT
ncbi:hypothetical protein KI387_003885, partial [Taxus chinensis]